MDGFGGKILLCGVVLFLVYEFFALRWSPCAPVIVRIEVCFSVLLRLSVGLGAG